MATIKTLVVKLVGDIAGFQETMQRGSRMVQETGRNIQSAGASIAGAFSVPAAGMALVLGDSVNQAQKLQAQLSGVQAVLGATAQETAKLQGVVEALAIDPQLKVSAQEAANAVEMLARNGLGVEEIMNGAARGVVLLSNATGGDFSQAADMATDVMALWKMEASELETAVNGITSVVNNSKFSVNDYALALAQGGGVAATVGVEFNDFNAAIAAMSPLFASGADAGTSFKTMMQRLVPQTNSAADAMKGLGLAGIDNDLALTTLHATLRDMSMAGNIEEANKFNKQLVESGDVMETLRNALGMTQGAFLNFQVDTGILQTAFHNMDGSMKSMPEVVDALNGSLIDLSDKQKTAALSTIFGTDAMRAAAGLASMTASEFVDLQSAMGDVSAAENAATRIDNLSGDMEIFHSVMGGLQLQLGGAFLPTLRQMVQQGTALMSAYGPVIMEMLPELTAKLNSVIERGSAFVSWIFDSTAVAGKHVLMIGGVVAGFVGLMGVLGPLMFVAGTIVSGIGAIMGAFGLLLGPVGLVIAAAAGLAVAWRENLFGMRDVVQEVVVRIQETLTPIADFATTLITYLQDGVEPLTAFKAAVFDAFGADGLAAVNGWIGTLTDGFNTITATGQTVINLISAVKSNLDAGVAPAIALKAAIFSVLGPDALATIAPVVGAIDKFLGVLKKTFGATVRDGVEPLQQAWRNLQPAVAPLLPLFQNVALLFGGAVAGAIVTVIGVVNGLVNGFLQALPGVTQAATGIVNVVSGAAGSLVAMFQLIIGWISGNDKSVTAAMLKLQRYGAQIWRGIYDTFDGMTNAVLGLISGFVTGALDYFFNLYETATGVYIPDLVNSIIEWIVTLDERVLALINGMIDSVVAQLEDWKARAIAKIQEIVQGIQDAFAIDWEVLGRGVVDGIVGGISKGAGAILNIARQAAQWAIDAAKEALGINSPSRAFMELGGYSVEGFVMAFSKDAIGEPVQNAITGAFDALRVPDLNATPSFEPIYLDVIANVPEIALPAAAPTLPTFDQELTQTIPAFSGDNQISATEHTLKIELVVEDKLDDLSAAIGKAAQQAVDDTMRKSGRRVQTKLRMK